MIVGAVGVKGAVRLKVFTNDLESVLSRGPVTLFLDAYSKGTQHDAKLMHKIKVGYALQISGVEDRTQAEGLKGVKLYVARESLPEIEEEDSFYFEDMEGLIAKDPDGQPFGVVQAIYNFGAGDLVEVQLDRCDRDFLESLRFKPRCPTAATVPFAECDRRLAFRLRRTHEDHFGPRPPTLDGQTQQRCDGYDCGGTHPRGATAGGTGAIALHAAATDPHVDPPGTDRGWYRQWARPR